MNDDCSLYIEWTVLIEKKIGMTLKTGSKLKGNSFQYVIERVLGQGSFGVTYKAKGYSKVKGAFGEMEVELPEPIAIKEFFMREVNQRGEDGSISGLTEGSLAYNYASKFRKEAERLAIMQHPNIVKVMDFVEANNTFYYVMEFIDGEDVSHYMKGKPLPEDEAISIIKDIAHALQYMHEEHKMLHLDLKPGNVMRRKSDGHIFLIDFGLSKHYNDDGQPDTSTTIGLGTEGYAPIEQGKRATSQNSFRPTIDVYALGGTLFKMLTGETPPAASDILDEEDLLNEIMGKHNVNPLLQKIVVEAMKPRVKQRTPSVAAFLKAIERLSGEEPAEEEDMTRSDLGVEEAPTIIEDKEEEEEASVVQATPVEEVKPIVQENKAVEKDVKNEVANSGGHKSMRKWTIIGACIVVLFVGILLLMPNKNGSPNSESTEKDEELVISVHDAYFTNNVLGGYVYAGPVDEDGEPNGFGEAKFTDGQTYKGYFEHGVFQGEDAEFKMKNGDLFIGSFVNNLFEKGTYTVAATGEYFEGTFKKGQPSVGTWYNSSGEKLQDIR